MEKTVKNNNLKQVIMELTKVPEAALFSHVSPDGDGLGSMLALGIALESMQKKVSFYNAGPIPNNLRLLPGIELINTSLPLDLPETLIFVDCAEAERAYSSIKSYFPGRKIINIDHHISNNFFGTYNWVDSQAAAAGEMVYKLIKKLDVTITKEIAINLYSAIITDTGRFSFSNTTAKSFKIAAELVKAGIDLVAINNILFEQKTLAQTKLLKTALCNLELLQGGIIAVIVLSRQDFQEAGAEENLSEGLVNYARNIENVEAAALLKEISDKEIKVSFRSNAWLDVNKIAAQFGGGGHVRASGCTIYEPLDKAKKLVVSALEEALELERHN
ncbi:MAG TPA: bifunctional oligoribonuclease/PAP phosphatase NrnA [Peptococcaceae bacterium]|nr:bifunctional oligoribonuclease/PAP phosphatase NrnA [Peptococcaceae bacterium]